MLRELARAAEIPAGAGSARQLRSEIAEQIDERLHVLLTRPDRTVLVAEDADVETLVGMVVLAEDEIGALFPVPVLRASHLVVAPSHRRKGVGRALLAAATQHADARGHEHVVTTSIPGSRDVNRYLARLGFVPLVSRRIASTATLRRTLGGAVPEQAALARRARILRGRRDGVSGRLVSRGA
jgi:predicted N-acetyltransferase YhbS